MEEQAREISLGEVTLEARLARPRGALAGPPRLAVIAHPMPTMGGSMDNNVVWALRDAALEAGLAALRVNFRGVGRSSGGIAGDARDAEDLSRLLAQVAGWPEAVGGLVGAGYSFGAWALVRALAAGAQAPAASGARPAPRPAAEWTSRMGALVLVAPPVALLKFPEALRVGPRPVLVITGEADGFGPPASVRAWLAGLGRAAGEVGEAWLAGADHFLGGREGEITSRVARWLEAHVGG